MILYVSSLYANKHCVSFLAYFSRNIANLVTVPPPWKLSFLNTFFPGLCEENKTQIWVARLAQLRMKFSDLFPVWRSSSSSYLSFCRTSFGSSALFRVCLLSWFRCMTHRVWRPPLVNHGGVDMRWTEDHLCQRTFPGRPVWSGAPMGKSFSLVIQMLASTGLSLDCIIILDAGIRNPSQIRYKMI